MTTVSQLRSSKTIYNDETKTWHDVKLGPIYGPQDSIGELVLGSLLKDPDHITQISYTSGKEYTNREIAQLSIRVAVNLEKLGLQQCDIIGLCAGNNDFIAPLVFGAMLAGMTISTLDSSFDKDGISHVFGITRPKIMFCDGRIYDTVKEGLEACNLASTPIYTVDDHREGLPSIMTFFEDIDEDHAFKPRALKEGSNQVAMILCSSGTTGLPKGVTMTHAGILNAIDFPLGPTDRILCFSSLYWLSGLLTLICVTIKGSTRIISNRAYTTDDFFDIVERYKVNIVFSPPSQIALSLASDKVTTCDMSSIKSYVLGGSAVPYVLVEKFQKYARNARFLVVYAMSEACSFVSYGQVDSTNTVGQLNANVDVKIIADDGKHVGANESGEICVRTICPWSGYFNNPQATEAIYQENHWVHSGDIGYFDDGGNLHIVDRIKDIMKYKNFHFSPTDIERTILEMPDVLDVCVVGISDMVATHLPAAAVVKQAKSSLTEDEIYEYVVDKRQHFEHLRGGVYFFDHLPLTASGKTLRRTVTEICENRRKLNLNKSDEDTVNIS